MTYLTLEMQGDDDADPQIAASYDEDATVRIANEAAENGFDQSPGPLTWLNSARITASRGEDAVHCVVSVGDPRGGFCFTVRRLTNGQIVLHVPHPDESFAHMKVEANHPGTMTVVHENGKPVDFSDGEDVDGNEDEEKGGDDDE